MKINPRDIRKFLEEGFKKVNGILLCGNNTKLIQEYSKSLCKNFDNEIKLSGTMLASDFSILVREIKMLPFSGKISKAIVINDVTNALCKPLQALKSLPDEVFLIFHGNRVTTNDPLRKFFETSPKLAVITCYMPDTAEMEAECDRYVAYMFERKFALAELELAKLDSSGIKITQIIRCALRYYMQLQLVLEFTSSGSSIEAALSLIKPPIFFKYVAAFTTALKKYSASDILTAIEQLINLEILLKTHDFQVEWTIGSRELFSILK